MNIAEANTRLDELTGFIELAKTLEDFTAIATEIRTLIYGVETFDKDIQRRLTLIISSIHTQLPLRDILFEPEFGPEERDSLLTLMKSFQFEGVILPHSSEDGDYQPGDSTHEDDKIKLYPRTELICELLDKLELTLEDCTVIVGEEPSKNLWRKTPYRAIVVPQLDRTILVCDGQNQSTFVLFTSNVPDVCKQLALHKSQLLKVARPIYWRNKTDYTAWQTKIAKTMFGDESQLLETETQLFSVDDEAKKLEVYEGRVKIPVRNAGGEATILIDGERTVITGLKAYLRKTVNRTHPAKIERLLRESGVSPVEGVCLWSSSKPHDAYEKSKLSVLDPVPFDRATGIATYIRNNETREAISVVHYAIKVAHMPPSTLKSLIKDAGLHPIKGVNVKIVDEIFDRTAVDILVEQYKSKSVPSDKGHTVTEVDGEAIEVVVAKVYYTALGGEEYFGVKYKNFFYHLSNNIEPVEGLKLAVQDVGTGALLSAYPVYKRSDFDNFASRYLQKL